MAKYQRLKRQYSIDGGNTWYDVTPYQYSKGQQIPDPQGDCDNIEWRIVEGEYICTENGGYVPPVQYRWVTAEGEVMCFNGSLYSVLKYQYSRDGGITWIDGGQTMTDELLEPNSSCCDDDTYICGQTIYRWVTVSGEYVCSGTTKYNKEKEQVSIDGGETWVDTGSTRRGSTVIEENSIDCGYMPRLANYSGNFERVNYNQISSFYENGFTEDVNMDNTYNNYRYLGKTYEQTIQTITVNSGAFRPILNYQLLSPRTGHYAGVSGLTDDGIRYLRNRGYYFLNDSSHVYTYTPRNYNAIAFLRDTYMGVSSTTAKFLTFDVERNVILDEYIINNFNSSRKLVFTDGNGKIWIHDYYLDDGTFTCPSTNDIINVPGTVINVDDHANFLLILSREITTNTNPYRYILTAYNINTKVSTIITTFNASGNRNNSIKYRTGLYNDQLKVFYTKNLQNSNFYFNSWDDTVVVMSTRTLAHVPFNCYKEAGEGTGEWIIKRENSLFEFDGTTYGKNTDNDSPLII